MILSFFSPGFESWLYHLGVFQQESVFQQVRVQAPVREGGLGWEGQWGSGDWAEL